MALITEEKVYIKIDANGNFVTYKNKSARTKEKKATPAEEVLKLYAAKISEYLVPQDEGKEREYYDTDAFHEEFMAWQNEAWKYQYDLQRHKKDNDYPLMAEFILDVKDSIPEIIASGNLGIKCQTAKEAYLKVKELKVFGDAVKDA